MSSGKQPFHHLGKGDPEKILQEYLKGNEPRQSATKALGSLERKTFSIHPCSSYPIPCAFRFKSVESEGLMRAP